MVAGATFPSTFQRRSPDSVIAPHGTKLHAISPVKDRGRSPLAICDSSRSSALRAETRNDGDAGRQDKPYTRICCVKMHLVVKRFPARCLRARKCGICTQPDLAGRTPRETTIAGCSEKRRKRGDIRIYAHPTTGPEDDDAAGQINPSPLDSTTGKAFTKDEEKHKIRRRNSPIAALRRRRAIRRSFMTRSMRSA